MNKNHISVLCVLLLVFFAHAKNNATFYMKDGSKKEAEFISLKSNVVQVRITIPDGSEILKEFPKETFTKIEKYDWDVVDLTQSDYPPVKKPDTQNAVGTKSSVPEKKSDTAAVSKIQPPVPPQKKDTVTTLKTPVSQPVKKTDTATGVKAEPVTPQKKADTVSIVKVPDSQSAKKPDSVVVAKTPPATLAKKPDSVSVPQTKDSSSVQNVDTARVKTTTLLIPLKKADSSSVVKTSDLKPVKKTDTITVAKNLSATTVKNTDSAAVAKGQAVFGAAITPAAGIFVPPPKVEKTRPVDTIVSAEDAKIIARLIPGGIYDPQTVSYVNVLWINGGTPKMLSNAAIGILHTAIRNELTVARFAYNPLPQTFVRDFTTRAGAAENLTIDGLAAIMDSTLVTKIVAIMNMYKELRIKRYSSDVERNLIFAQKAKEYEVTVSELANIINSAFVYVPCLSNYNGIRNGNRVVTSLNAGVVWYRISTKDFKAKSMLSVKYMAMAKGVADVSADVPYVYDGKSCTPQEYSFRTCADKAARSVHSATQKMAELKLSALVTEANGGTVGFELGTKNKLAVDDKFVVSEFEEGKNGTVKQVNTGWVSVIATGSSSTTGSCKATARICAGSPVAGTIVSEYSQMPFDVTFKTCMFPGLYKNDCLNQQLSGIGVGGQLDVRYHAGKLFGINQLLVGIGAGLGVADISDPFYKSLKAEKVTHLNFDGFLMKRFGFGRCALGLDAGIQFQTASVPLTIAMAAAKEDFAGIGFFGGINFGVAFSPDVEADLGVRYHYAGLDGVFSSSSGSSLGWDPFQATMSGIGVHLGLTYSPPAVRFE